MLNERLFGRDAYDKVTDFKGTVTGFAQYIGDEEDQVRLEGKDTTGRPIAVWVSADRVLVRNDVPKPDETADEDNIPEPSIIDILNSIIDDLKEDEDGHNG